MRYKTIGQMNDKISILGFGAMRLPLKSPNTADIDEEKAAGMMLDAIDSGVNYIDTAYLYHGGNEKKRIGGASEEFVGNLLAGKYGYPKKMEKNGQKDPETLRKSVFLATKLPTYMLETKKDCEHFFEIQLQKLKTDYIDFYLLHDIKKKSWQTVLDLDVLSFMESLKQDGKIKYIGFSFHDDIGLFKEVIDAYKWDFCQIQYNYIDTDYQAGEAGLEYAHQKNIPVFIMEPLKGGRLSMEPPKDIKKIMKESHRNWTPAEWSLRFLWGDPRITMILSGMTKPEHVFENIKIAGDNETHFTDRDRKIIENIQRAYAQKNMIGCTDCKYCMPCPSGVDIPKNISYVEEIDLYGPAPGVFSNYVWSMSKDVAASNCIDCGLCLDKCPQAIDIPFIMKRAEQIFEKKGKYI